MKSKKLKIEDLNKDLQELLFQEHSHAEIEFEFNSDQIVYTEKSVLKIINYLLNNNK